MAANQRTEGACKGVGNVSGASGGWSEEGESASAALKVVPIRSQNIDDGAAAYDAREKGKPSDSSEKGRQRDRPLHKPARVRQEQAKSSRGSRARDEKKERERLTQRREG